MINNNYNNNEQILLLQQDNNFNSYLAGLLERDGSIFISKTNENLEITFTFDINNLALNESIKSQRGFGYKSITGKRGRYRIRNLARLYQLALQINGLLRTTKIFKFELLVSWLNSKNQKLNLIPLDNNCIGSNSWLSGGSLLYRE